jgi:uncharacterized RDD family membrane protein YckC
MHYPRLIRRIRALLIDFVIILIVLVLSFLLAGVFEQASNLIRAAIAFIPVILYEPLLVSIKGGTIGHQIMGVEVVSVKSKLRLNFLVSLFRSILKFIFGFPSLYFVLTTKNHQALHDILSNSLVVIKADSSLPLHEKLDIRTENLDYVYPSKLRRVSVTVGYVAVAFIALILSFVLFMSESCIESNKCNNQEHTFNIVINLLFWLLFGYFLVAGWRSRLYGCRRIKASSAKNQAPYE